MLLAGFYFASVFNMQNRSLCACWSPLAQFRAWQSFAGFLFDDFHWKIMSVCSPQDGCSVTLAGLSSAAVSMGFTSSADCQTLLRHVLGALLRGLCTSLNQLEVIKPEREHILDLSPISLQLPAASISF